MIRGLLRFGWGALWIMLISRSTAQTPQRIDLGGNWQFQKQGVQTWLPATVPGTVHTDLLALKAIADPLKATNDTTFRWIENLDWEYRKAFTLTESELQFSQANLVFEGIDTYSEIYLNGQFLGRTDNMHRQWAFACKPNLKVGANELRVKLRSPITQALPAYRASEYELPSGNDAAQQKLSPYIRKAAYHFGWDFTGRAVTAGMWRPVYLRLWKEARIESAYARPLEINEQEAKMSADVWLDVVQETEYEIEIQINGANLAQTQGILHPGRNEVKMRFSIPDPKPWWPKGMGDPYLYDLDVKLRQGGKVIDQHSQKLGLRTIKLVMAPDAIGTNFQFSINDFLPGKGGPLFIKGANYVPTDVFLPRGRAKRQHLLESAEAVGMNMLRVWGGGVYEDDEFYDWCDAHGILVWQDLMFACMMYPLKGDFEASASKEVEENILRLRRHPSMAIWCGNNEIDVAWHNWGWQAQFQYPPQFEKQRWEEYKHFFEEKVPALVQDLHPEIAYIPTSPLSNWGKEENFAHKNMHYWGVWHGTDSLDGFSHYVPRFMTEYGFQSWPSPTTLKNYVEANDWSLDSPNIQNRQKSYKGNAPILRFLIPRYGQPKDFTSFLLLSQYLQSDAMTLAIEAHRLAAPRCMGTLYWQLNDCWPAASWSTIDFDGAWKPAHYALRRLYAPVLVAADVLHDSVSVRIHSEIPPRACNLQLRLKSFQGDILADFEQTLDMQPGAKQYLHIPLAALASKFDPRTTFLEVVLHAGRNILADDLHYFAAPKDLDLPDPDFKYQITRQDDRYLLELTSKTLVKNLEIQLADGNATFSDNFFDLVPGRPKTITIQAEGIENENDLLKRLRFRDLGRVI
jgi:beta-mannosidase